MPAHQAAVGQDATVADRAIVADVAVGHEKVVIADRGPHGMRCAAMDGYLFAKDVEIADFGGSGLIVVFEVLRLFSQHGAGVNHVSPAHGQRTAYKSMGPQNAIRANGYLPFDDGMSADYDAVGQFRFRGYDGRRMDARRLIRGHSRPLFRSAANLENPGNRNGQAADFQSACGPIYTGNPVCESRAFF